MSLTDGLAFEQVGFILRFLLFSAVLTLISAVLTLCSC